MSDNQQTQRGPGLKRQKRMDKTVDSTNAHDNGISSRALESNPDSTDVTRKRFSLGSLTFGLWELAIKSAISIVTARKRNGNYLMFCHRYEGQLRSLASMKSDCLARNKLFKRRIQSKPSTQSSDKRRNISENMITSLESSNDCEVEGNVSTTSQPLVPPLPSVPPVGPGRLTPRLDLNRRSQTIDRSHTSISSRTFHQSQALVRSQSVTDVFLSSMFAAKVKLKSQLDNSSFARNVRCQECSKKFSFTFRRHHCRTCKRSVCAYCSSQPVMTDTIEETDKEVETDTGSFVQIEAQGEGEPDVEGRGRRESGGDANQLSFTRQQHHSGSNAPLNRICRKCASELEGKQLLHMRTWTEEYRDLRQFFKQERHRGEVLDPNNSLPPKIPRLPPMCNVLASSFVEEFRKNQGNMSRLLATTASFNSGLQYALKPSGQKMCRACNRPLRFPVERKSCTLCYEVFCSECSSRDLVLSLPDSLDPGGTIHEIGQVTARILSAEESAELERDSNNVWHTNATYSQRYRVCNKCLENVRHVINVMTFNSSLTQLEAELKDLQEQIVALVDDDTDQANKGSVSRWPSLSSVHTYSSTEDEIAGETVTFRITQKLLERYFQVYLQLERLRPETSTQKLLFKHVKQALSNFYMTRRSIAAKRFDRQASYISLPFHF